MPCLSPGESLGAEQAVDQMFDYASFMWDGGDMWPTSTDFGVASALPPPTVPSVYHEQSAAQLPHRSPDVSFPDGGLVAAPSEPCTRSDTSPGTQDGGEALPTSDAHRLMDYFIHAVTPPILAEVETQKKWFAMRQVLVKRASASRMVRWAVLAFSNLLLCRRDGAWMASSNNYYESAAAEVQASDGALSSLVEHSARREDLLATLFFLSYVDILEGRLDAAHSNLKRAFAIFQNGREGSFGALEKQFLLWIRLLDARAVTAGGEGLFLAQDDEAMLVQASPASLDLDGPEGGPDEQVEGDIEDILFQLLYQPGILFFQKVQSFMGRISKIDPWHRSRGTVEDEREVMNVGAAIASDLRALYEQRPLLMDHAVAGKLTAPHVSAHLAFVITRSFRTYLSHYYASQVHLHRVAYKTFPLTREAREALAQIGRLTRLIAAGLDGEDDALPVNMLWPLLMLGSEEQDPEARAWIRAQILRMERVAGNARLTAAVLDEVQARQDASKTRADIRAVMHDTFNSCFAIV